MSVARVHLQATPGSSTDGVPWAKKQQAQALADYDLVAPPPPPAADAAMGQPAAGTHNADGDPGMPATAPEVNNPVVDDTDQLLEGTNDLTDHTLKN